MNLNEYIRQAKDLEVSLYKQGIWCDQLRRDIYQMQHPQQKAEIVYSPAPEVGKALFGFVLWPIMGAIAGGALCLAIAIFCIFSSWEPEAIIIPILIGGGAVVGFGIAIWLTTSESAEKNKKIRETAEENKNIARQNKINIENARKQLLLLEPQLEKAEQYYAETKKVLMRHYDRNIIFEKYRTMVPICMFYEYLESGRCNELKGHEGAYNIYENEIRMNIILSKLDEIIERLDRIEQNQYVIANAIRESHTQLNRLYSTMQDGLNRLEDISQNTSLSAYYNQITAMNTSCILWLESKK